jgi:hypothetical protein
MSGKLVKAVNLRRCKSVYCGTSILAPPTRRGAFLGHPLNLEPMKVKSLFKKQVDAVTRARESEAEKLLAEGFRALGTVCTRIADFLEQQRLAKEGYEGQGKFLERLDQKEPKP